MSTLRHRGSVSPPPSPTHSRKRSLSPSFSLNAPLLPFPTSALLGSVAGAAHYSGARVDPDALLQHRNHELSGPDHHRYNHERVLNDLKELYCCRPTLEIFDRLWSRDAVFEDPLSHCYGFNEYAPQWFAMPKLFSASQTLGTRIMSSTAVPNRLIYEQTQEYTLRWLGYKKRVHSIIVVDMDEDEKIVRLIDQWDGQELPSRFGTGLLRRLNAKLTPWLVRLPKPAA